MVAFKVDTFGGMIPAADSRLIPDKSAVLAQNVWLYSGALTGLPQPQLLRNCVAANTTKVFRLPNNYADSVHLLDSDWLEFVDPDTDVVRGGTINDTYDRYYWASPTQQPMYNTRARIKAGSAPYILGVPQPGSITTLNSYGGTGVATSRAYTYTFVSEFGEEGPPATSALRNGKIDDTWIVGMTPPAGTEPVNRSLTKTRVYRTVTSSAGAASYFLVAELPIASSSYVDTLTDTIVSANSILPSTNWTAPPTDLKGLTTLPNGMIAGFRANELWYCEPFRPHAWPSVYTNVTDYPIVGLAASGTALIVLTQGSPYIATGNNPSSVSLTKMTMFMPCISRGSIVSAPDGVRFASTNGLALITQGQAINSTRQVLSPDKWRQLVELPTLRGTMVGSAYMAYGSSRQGVFDTSSFSTSVFTQTDLTGAYDGFFFEVTDPRIGYSVLKETTPTANIMNDVWSGETFIIRNNTVYWLNIGDTAPTREAYLWRSKVYQPVTQKNMSAMAIYFTVPPNTPTQNPVRNIATIQTLASDQYGIIRMYGDGKLIFTREIRTSGELMRLPSGLKYEYFQFEIEARVEIYSFEVATSVKELTIV